MPYVGILTGKGSFSTTITPMLDLKFDQTITSLDLQATGCNELNHGNSSASYGQLGFGGSQTGLWAGMNNLHGLIY